VIVSANVVCFSPHNVYHLNEDSSFHKSFNEILTQLTLLTFLYM